MHAGDIIGIPMLSFNGVVFIDIRPYARKRERLGPIHIWCIFGNKKVFKDILWSTTGTLHFISVNQSPNH